MIASGYCKVLQLPTKSEESSTSNMTNGTISSDDDSSSAAMLPQSAAVAADSSSNSTNAKNSSYEQKKEKTDETLITVSNGGKSSTNNKDDSKSWMTGKTKASLISLVIVIVVLVFATVFFSNSNREDNKTHSPIVDDESAFRREFLQNMTKEAWNVLMTNSSSTIEYDKHRGRAIVAGMSTLHLMQLTEQFEAGRAWIEANLSNLKTLDDIEVKVLLGDYLGGLISCYSLTRNQLFKEKALEVLTILEPAFNSTTGLLYSHLNPSTGKAFGRRTAISWIGHQQPELLVAITSVLSSREQQNLLKRRLQVIESFVAEKVTKVRGHLYMHIIDVESGAWLHQITTLGSRGIDFYYNLLRAYRLNGQTEDNVHLMTAFVEAMESVIQAGMLRKSTKTGLFYALEYNLVSESYAKAMATSACRLGGMLALASSSMKLAKIESKSNLTSSKMLELASSLTETCYQTANKTASKLLPLELWTSGMVSQQSQSSAALGSFNGFYELAESYLHLWRTTGDPRYREYGWELATALQRHARTVEGDYAAVKDVNSVPTSLNGDHRSVHYLAATFKYLYLLFSDNDDFPVDRWIFNAFGQLLPVAS